jgi:drug/metabolite transporter (DMT)-like permease
MPTETSTSHQPRHHAVLGALLMLGAGCAFAGVNVLTPIITYRLGLPSTSAVFWQYAIATLFSLPLVWRLGLDALRSRHWVIHVLRAVLSVAGVQAWGLGFASGVELWQMIALSMTAPFFVLAGATLFLGEKITPARLGATLFGFAGAMLVARVWTAEFSTATLLPVLAAALWAAATLLTKFLARDESPESVTLFMVLLITPLNALFALPEGFAVPAGTVLWLTVLLGLATAVSQYLLTRAYAVADATYLQPFDDLKLPLNLLLGWIVLGQVPDLWFWPGAAMILAASLFIMGREAQARRGVANLEQKVGELEQRVAG